jgi:hypothetical protein
MPPNKLIRIQNKIKNNNKKKEQKQKNKLVGHLSQTWHGPDGLYVREAGVDQSESSNDKIQLSF